MMLFLLFFMMLLLIFLGMDIGFSMGVAALIYILLTQFMDFPLKFTILPVQMFDGVNSFSLVAIPLFILAGEIMSRGGITTKLVRFASSLVGSFRGGLGHTAVVVNMIMAGMSGSAVADCAATGSVLIPAMRQKNYSASFAGAIVASASTIGPIIPPSIPLVILGSIGGVSVSRLFIGGVIPGALMGIALMAYVGLYAKKAQLPKDKAFSSQELWSSFKDSVLPLGMPVVILGGILTGMATPTEAAVLGVLYSLVITLFIYRSIRVHDLLDIFIDSGVSSMAVAFTVSTGVLFGWVATAENMGPLLLNLLLSISKSTIAVLFMINILLLILGMIMEAIPIILLLTPILFPMLGKLGVDPVHFGVVVCLNLMIGLLTPPIGLNLFICSTISKISVERIVRDVWPMILFLLLVLGLITVFPPLVNWLPNLLMGRR
jgi:tripartite ATP-independent transporter DctM subunit